MYIMRWMCCLTNPPIISDENWFPFMLSISLDQFFSLGDKFGIGLTFSEMSLANISKNITKSLGVYKVVFSFSGVFNCSSLKSTSSSVLV